MKKLLATYRAYRARIDAQRATTTAKIEASGDRSILLNYRDN